MRCRGWRASSGLLAFMAHGFVALPFWLALAGIATAWYLYSKRTDLPRRIAIALGPLYALVERKFGFDELYAWLFAGGARAIGRGFWRGGGPGPLLAPLWTRSAHPPPMGSRAG